MSYYAFIAADNKVFGYGQCQDGMEPYVQPPTGSTLLTIPESTYRALIASDFTSWSKVGGTVQQRLALPVAVNKQQITANGIDAIVISGVPNPSQVSIGGSGSDPSFVTVTDGVITITSEDPTSIVVTIRHPNYMEWRATYAAV